MESTLPAGPGWPGALQALATAQLPLFMQYCSRRYGDRFTVRMGRFGTYVYLSDPADIRAVFHGDDAVFHAGEANAPFLGRVLGPSSVLCTDDDVHLRQRRHMSGPFHGPSVAALAPVMAEVAAEDVAGWPIGVEFAVLPHMRRVTLEVILRAVIGVDGADHLRLAELRQTLSSLVDLNLLMMAPFAFPGLARFWPWTRYAAVQARADELIYAEIDRCQRAPDLEQRRDVLALLVRGGGMTTAELRDQLVTLLLAGHETTATGLAWTLERLVRHPAALARAEGAARDGADGGYLDAVITESLRVRPVVPDITRRLMRDVIIGEGDRELRLPAGVFVDPAIYLVMRSEASYPDPLAFRPERVLGARPDPSVWLPFGGGSRRCLGASFAHTEMRVILATVLRSIELVTTTARDERTRVRHVTLAPHRGARVTAARRHRPTAPASRPEASVASA
jgi:cytochrome P450